MAEHMFPLLGSRSIPWRLLAPHHDQAQKNHGQTLEQLAARGGLSPAEALAVIESRRWRPGDREAMAKLDALVAANPAPPVHAGCGAWHCATNCTCPPG